jgi:hypothetical protein
MIKHLARSLAGFFGDRSYARRRRQLFLSTLAVVVVADLWMAREHTAFFWEALPGWNALFGFLSCLVLILVAKFLWHRCKLEQPEDYYD